jgi:hypothetical protein
MAYCHVCPADEWVRDLGVESGNTDELDSTISQPQQVFVSPSISMTVPAIKVIMEVMGSEGDEHEWR